ncbi:hypothetical protein KKD80_00355 [Patescibacteria group bacterium]|nr:hypothetical protein [Patescibacteria group bacterium]
MKFTSKKSIVAALFVLILVISALPVFAQREDLQTFGKEAYGEAQAQYQENQGPVVITGKVIKAFLGILGIVMVILVLYGGFLWMTAAGNTEKIEKAKKILGNAVVGIIIIIMAYGISFFVIDQLLKAAGTP